jgi:hypothetical protein
MLHYAKQNKKNTIESWKSKGEMQTFVLVSLAHSSQLPRQKLTPIF